MAAVGYWTAPENRARVIVDERGIEWEVYDEATWSIELALEWDVMPQTDNPGLIFASATGRRRLWPCPDRWNELPDARLVELLGTAKLIF